MMTVPESHDYKSKGPYTAIAMNSPRDTQVGYAKKLPEALTCMWQMAGDNEIMVCVIDSRGFMVYCYHTESGMTATAETFAELEKRIPAEFADGMQNLLQVELANRLMWPTA